jgi:UDP-N-acetylglucosamine 3-dehydrogenase
MIRVGVIGLGAFGEFQIQALQGLPGVELAAVASRSADRAREIAARFHATRWYDDYAALCADPEVDAVTIATAEDAHVAPAIAALRAGKHVLVEKPLATNRADALAIRNAARTASGWLMPGHIVRFEPRYVALKRAVEAREMGTVAALHASRNRPRATLATYGRCHPALVTAIHDIDACLWLTGERPVAVRAWDRLERGPEGVYGIWGTFVFPGGALATIEATWMMPDDTGLEIGDVFSVTGTRGIANIDMGSSGLRIVRAGRTQGFDTGYQPWGHDGIGGALQAELAHFLLLAEGRVTEPVVTVDDGVNAVIAAEAMIASATAGKEIAIDWDGIS